MLGASAVRGPGLLTGLPLPALPLVCITQIPWRLARQAHTTCQTQLSAQPPILTLRLPSDLRYAALHAVQQLPVLARHHLKPAVRCVAAWDLRMERRGAGALPHCTKPTQRTRKAVQRKCSKCSINARTPAFSAAAAAKIHMFMVVRNIELLYDIAQRKCRRNEPPPIPAARWPSL